MGRPPKIEGTAMNHPAFIAPANDGSDVLQRFASREWTSIGVVQDAKKLIDHLAAFGKQHDRQVELVDAAISARRLNLVVFGGENGRESPPW